MAWTWLTIDGRDVDGLTLAAQAAGKITGRVIFEDGEPPPDAAKRYDVYAEPADQRGPQRHRPTEPSLRPDLTFEIDGLWGPQYLMLRTFGGPGLSQAPPWHLKSMRLGGQDITGLPIDVEPDKVVKDVEVVLTTRATRLTGTVTDARGTPLSEAAILIFSEDRARWRDRPLLMMHGLNREKRLESSGLIPHEYLVIALPRLEGELLEGGWQDPEFLESLRPLATRIALAHGETRELSLRLVDLPASR